MGDEKLRIFEFQSYEEPGEEAGKSRDLIGDAPLTLEEEKKLPEDAFFFEGKEPEPSGVSGPSEPPESPPPPYAPFVLETVAGRLFFQGAGVRETGERIAYDGFLLFFKDFHSVSGLGVLQLQGASHYADVLARKKLGELGELSDADQLLLYAVSRGKGREFSVLYQVVRRESLRTLEENCRSHAQGMQYADTLGLLCGLLDSYGKKRPRACVLKLPGALLLLAADARQFLFARRYSFMDQSRKSLSGCLAAVRRDVAAVCPGLSIIQLVETGAREEEHGLLVACLAAQPGFDSLRPALLQEAGAGGYLSALPGLMESFSPAYALGPGSERVLRPLERFERPLWLVLCAGILLCCWLGWHAQRQLRILEAQSAALRLQIRETTSPAANAPRLPAAAFASRARLAALLDRARNTPGLAVFWNALGTSKPETLSVTSLRLAYGDNAVRVELQGRLFAGVRESQRVAAEYLDRLRETGAEISEHDLRLNHNGEQFFSVNLAFHRRGD